MYIQEGKNIFFKTLNELQIETGEQKLGKAIARVMKNHQRTEVNYLKIAK
jgi:Cu-processing system ATP-binding protein